MPDRRPKPERPAPSPDEPATGPRHPATPTPDEPPKAGHQAGPADQPDAIGGEAASIARALRDLVRSLPDRPGPPAPVATRAMPEGIPGIAPPAFDVPAAEGRRPEAVEEGLAGDAIPHSADRIDFLPGSFFEAKRTISRDLRGEDRGEEVIATVPVAPPSGDPAVPLGLSQHPSFFDEARAPSSPGLLDEARWPEGGGIRGLPPGASELAASMPGVPAPNSAVAEPAIGVGFPMSGPVGATIEVGPVGLAARRDEGLDTTIGPAATTNWGDSPGDPFAGPRGPSPCGAMGAGGVDLGPTNALLGQILDELRRRSQPAPIASARSVYPER